MMLLHQEMPWLCPPPADFNSLCRQLVAEPGPDAVETLRALAGTALNPNQLSRLAAAIAAFRKKSVPLSSLASWRLGVLGNGTADFLVDALVATGVRHGFALECVAAGYDQAIQDALDPASELNRSAPDGVLIALDWRGLGLRPEVGQSRQNTVAAALERMGALREAVKTQNPNAICLIQNLATPPETLFGSFDRVVDGTLRSAIAGINEGLAELVRGSGDVLFDVALLAETVGLENWHSPAEWNLARLPFSQTYIPIYADHICRLISALRGKSRRCLVLDLDNTLWGGVIGDDGVHGIRIAPGDPAGEPYLLFQRYVLSLRERGVVLAVCSKNDDRVARQPFRDRSEMILREEHFAVFQANWQDKASNLTAIASELALGLESLVFVDDNPFERELVRRSLPRVAVPELPDDAAWYARILSAAGYFEAVTFSEEDSRRAAYYEQNSRRAAVRKQAADLGAYLQSLEMEIWFRPFDQAGRARIAQLINKSNQFNLTTRRYSEAEVARLEDSPEHFTLQVRLTDTFGDNGIISIVICRDRPGQEWEIDTWLMSCRVLGRGVERALLRELLDHAARRGIVKLRGCYIATGRNQLVENLYADLGFEQTGTAADGMTSWVLNVAGAQIAPPPMIVHSEGFETSELAETKWEQA